jgi:hypothetical protein
MADLHWTGEQTRNQKSGLEKRAEKTRNLDDER